MMKKGWIEEVVSNEPGVERKRLYCLTASGKEALTMEINRLRRMLANTEGV